MIYGFEWVKDIDRQLQYVHKKPKENVYTPITEETVYGFQWVKDVNRQQQYVHKEPKENIYTPIIEKAIYGFEWIKDTNSQKQFSKRVLPKTLIYSNDKYKALDDKVRSYNINYSLMSALEKYGTEPDNLRDVENAFNKKQYINNKYEETENGKVFEEKLNHVIKNAKIV